MKDTQKSLTTVVVESGRAGPVKLNTDGNRQEPSKYSPELPTDTGVSWQTPTVSTGAHSQKDGSMTAKLDGQVKQWATPRSGKTTDENPETWALRQAKGDVATMPLTAQVKAWSTPQTRDARSGDPARREDPARSKNLNDQMQVKNAKLNPRWVETLMGLPVGWTMPSCAEPRIIARTNCDSSATESCRHAQPSRSAP